MNILPRLPASRLLLVITGCLLAVVVEAAQPLFDAHLHYNPDDAKNYTPAEIIALLRANSIIAASITSRPPEGVLPLYAEDPARIVPMLGVYRTLAEKQTWTSDEALPDQVERALSEGPWRAVGELHLFAGQRHSPVFLRIAELATERGLPMQLHCDPAVLDALFDRLPQARVIWAHAGAFPYPPLLRNYLDRYPGLYIDLSVRDQRLAPAGRLDPEWELLLIEYSDRFMVGVDTYRTERWGIYGKVADFIRHWLDQLPADVSRALAFENAARVFGYQPSTDR
jgi:hypothetical protein